MDDGPRPRQAKPYGLRSWLLKAVLPLCVGLPLGLLPSPAMGQVRDTRVGWRTVHSEHFNVHYHEPLGLLARKVAALAERAQQRLAPLLGNTPKTKTEIVLSDGTNAANGSATAIPYNTIRLFATAPDDLSTLGDYDDWLHLLVTHEHTHILHLDNISGLPAIINVILGRTYIPNSLQPRWVLEGLATYEESRESSGGRLRSTYSEMYLRMDALENRFLRIDQLSNNVDRWPRGSSWYLYGSRFIKFIAARYGDVALKQIATVYGGQAIPYGINRVARRATGRGFDELYGDFLDSLRRKYEEQQATVLAQGPIIGRRLTQHGERSANPRFIDNTNLVYFTNDGFSNPMLRTLTTAGEKKRNELVRVAGSTAHPSVDRKAGKVYYQSGDGVQQIYFLPDLFSVDLETGKRTRLTHGLRVGDAEVSPDGQTVVYTVNGAGTRHLMIADADAPESSRRILVRSSRFEQIYSPRSSPDGTRVAYSCWRTGGYRDIRIVDVNSGAIVNITHDRAMDMGPAWAPDGEALYFSSDRTGIANIYKYDFVSGNLQQITNVIAGAFQPALSPDGRSLAYVGYNSWGFDLYLLDLEGNSPRSAPLYIDDRPASTPSVATEAALSHSYNPLPTLYPRAYSLELTEDGFGQRLNLLVEGGDAVGYNFYQAQLGISLTEGHLSPALLWRYSRSWIPITFRLFRTIQPRGGLVVGGRGRIWEEEVIGGEISGSYRFPRSFDSHTLSVGYGLNHRGPAEPFGGDLDPNDPPPRLPSVGFVSNARVSWAYSDVQRQIYDISPSAGHSFRVNVSLADPLIDDAFAAISTNWEARQFVPIPLPSSWRRTHVLALRYAGGISAGDENRRARYGLGGYPSVDLLDSLVNQAILGSAALRGYPPFARVGTQFHVLQTEYRFLVFRAQAGVVTLPVYLHRLHASVFVDYGNAFTDGFPIEDFAVGAGAELLTEFILGYYLNFTLRIGMARGFSEGGETQVYANLGVPF